MAIASTRYKVLNAVYKVIQAVYRVLQAMLKIIEKDGAKLKGIAHGFLPKPTRPKQYLQLR